MALFEITPKEHSDMNLWLGSINREAQSRTLAKSTYYDFDFVKGGPSNKAKRFEWLSDDAEEEFTTRPTIDQSIQNPKEFKSFFDTPEEIDQIPSIDSENF